MVFKTINYSSKIFYKVEGYNKKLNDVIVLSAIKKDLIKYKFNFIFFGGYTQVYH